MKIPSSAQVLIDKELQQLAESSDYSLQPETRIEIYAAFGHSIINDDQILAQARKNKTLPLLSACGHRLP